MANDIDLVKAEEHRNRAAKVIRGICHKYGLFGNLVYYSPSVIPGSDRNRLYIVAGLDRSIEGESLPDFIKPEEIIRRSERNDKLFYPKAWAYDLFENPNDFQAQQDLVDYCSRANFLAQIYQEYGAELPDKLRNSEINRLIEYRQVMDDPGSAPAMKARCARALNIFFKREKTQNLFRKRWLSYYRSEHFPDDKGAIGRLIGYFKRNSNKMKLRQLMEVNSDLHKLEMQEHEYKIFVQLMSEKHPDVLFSPGDKEVVDHGLMKASSVPEAFGRAVTGEEFAVIRKDRFAKEGFSAIADLRPSYWEFRDVYYRSADEPLVAGVYNQITLSYAKCNSLMEMKERGNLKLEKIPISDFMNFVSLAKSNKFRFYIDNDGDYSVPSLEYANIIYNGYQEEKLIGIKKRMIDDKITYSHLYSPQHPPLTKTLKHIEKNNSHTEHKKTLESHIR